MDNVAWQTVYAPANMHPERVALISRTGEIFTYAQLARAVGQVASLLRRHGVGPGQVVGLSMGSHPLHLLTLLAVAQLGAVSLPLHPAVPAERRSLAAGRFAAALVVSEEPGLALPGLPFIRLDPAQLTTDAPVDNVIEPVDAAAAMHILLSSGTSGNPKAVLWTHGNVALRNRTDEPEGPEQKRVLQLDLNFFAGIGPAMRALAHGDALVFPSSMSAEHVLIALITQRVTHAYLSPHQAAIVAGLVGVNVRHACPDLVSLRIVGDHLPPRARELLTRLSPNVYVVYGSTESGVVTMATPAVLARRPDTAGAACPWAEIQVVDEEGRPQLPDVPGILRLRSSQMVAEYHLDPERTAAGFRDGWFYPGDRGRIDVEGLLHVDGRIDDMINVGGAMMDAADIERTLATHPAVREAGAFITELPDGQPLLSAALVLDRDVGLNEIGAFAQARLGPLAPQRYVMAAALPRTGTGKLLRRHLATSFAVVGAVAAPAPAGN